MNPDSENPLITLILFGYNQEHFVREAIAGAISQTYSPLEILFSDDSSTDSTFSIMQEAAAAYQGPHRIILNRNEQNRSVGAHVNAAFGLATGEWIVTAASDDVSDAGRCARVAEVAKAHPDAGVIGLGWRDIDEDGEPFPGRMLGRYQEGRINKAGDPAWINQFRDGDFGAWGMSVAWKTSLVRQWPPLADELRQEDEVYSFRAALMGMSIVLDPEPVASYRHHGNNVSGYDPQADIETTEKRRIARARMNLATWRFLSDELESPPAFVSSLWSERQLATLRTYLGLKIKACEDNAGWWDCGTLGRLRRSLFPAERRRLIHRPREWKRILPYPWFLYLSTREANKRR